LYPTGDEYLPVVGKWLVSDPGVLSGVSKNDQKMALLSQDKDCWLYFKCSLAFNPEKTDTTIPLKLKILTDNHKINFPTFTILFQF
jgi:hypothetical protein